MQKDKFPIFIQPCCQHTNNSVFVSVEVSFNVQAGGQAGATTGDRNNSMKMLDILCLEQRWQVLRQRRWEGCL